jgi:putative ABC transport system permease protein
VAVTVVIVLALGIGANATLFSVLDTVWLRAIPYPNADRLVLLLLTPPGGGRQQPVWADLEGWRQSASFAFEEFSAFTNARNVTIEFGNSPALLSSRLVDDRFFDLLGESALVGRLFDASTPPGGEIIVTERIWRARLGAHPQPETLAVKLNGQPVTIIGIVPDRIRSVQESDVFLRLVTPQGPEREWVNATGLGRLRPGTDARDAERSLVHDPRRGAPTAIAVRDHMVGANVGRVLMALWGLTVLVLLVASVNVSVVLLSGFHRRRAEMAIRTSLGASRLALYRQVLAETSVLVAFGFALALVLASTAMSSVVSMMPPTPGADTIGVNWRVIATEATISAVLCLAISLLPVVSLSELRPVGAMVTALSSGQGWQLPGLRRLLSGLVAIEVAMATVAVAITALIVSGFARLIAVDPGFEPSNVVVVEVRTLRGLPLMGHETQVIESEALETLRSLPGVAAAGSTDQLPLGGSNAQYSVSVDGAPQAGAVERMAHYRRVSSGYLEAMRIPVRAGRSCNRHDVLGAPRVVLINQRMAAEYFPGQNPIDERLSLGGGPPATIVGVVGDVRAFGLDRDPVAEVYGCRSQEPSGGATFVVRFHDGALRADRGIGPSTPGLDRLVQVRAARPLDEWVSRAVAEPRFRAQLCTVFGILVLLLVTVGVGAATTQAIVQRRREFGVRLALGASGARLRRDVLWSSMMPALLGIVAGLIVTSTVRQTVADDWLSTSRADAWSVAAGITLVVLTAASASLIASRTIISIDPADTLRCN